jgi:hypothetical protein
MPPTSTPAVLLVSVRGERGAAGSEHEHDGHDRHDDDRAVLPRRCMRSFGHG